MKFSICLAAAALTLSASVFAQTAQTFHFGEGDSKLPAGNAHPAAQAPANPPAHANHTKHRRRHRAHVTQPDTYSHN
ncbi:hypothetical protein P3T18_006847 [Paraburkholderia sp. GAS199]|uniref:hypothetical protein n=1 Tax=Paraburkholderia sp. GAS199 TaxID=3035126 RepID=UPI003D1CDB00